MTKDLEDEKESLVTIRRNRELDALPPERLTVRGMDKKVSGLTDDGRELLTLCARRGDPKLFIASKLGIGEATLNKLLTPADDTNVNYMAYQLGDGVHDREVRKLVWRHAKKSYAAAKFYAISVRGYAPEGAGVQVNVQQNNQQPDWLVQTPTELAALERMARECPDGINSHHMPGIEQQDYVPNPAMGCPDIWIKVKKPGSDGKPLFIRRTDGVDVPYHVVEEPGESIFENLDRISSQMHLKRLPAPNTYDQQLSPNPKLSNR